MQTTLFAAHDENFDDLLCLLCTLVGKINRHPHKKNGNLAGEK